MQLQKTNHTKSTVQIKTSDNTDPPRCLVLLAAWNGAPHLREQLQSIVRQSRVTVDTILADDASTDSTSAIAEEFFPRVHVHRRNVGTGSAAQNFSALIRESEASQYDYVALSDQDDIWMPCKLHNATQALSQCGAAGYSASVIARWPNGTEKILRQSPRLRDADFLFEGAGQGCTFVLSSALFQSIQKIFRNSPEITSHLIYHDWAIYAASRCLGAKWYFDAGPSLWYRQHHANDTGARWSLSGIRTRLHLLSTGKYRTQVSAISRLCRKVAPSNMAVGEWAHIEDSKRSVSKRFKKAVFCLRHGRRRTGDRVATALAALIGWV